MVRHFSAFVVVFALRGENNHKKVPGHAGGLRHSSRGLQPDGGVKSGTLTITLRFLGTAAGVPVPHAGCVCHQCDEARNERRLRRTRSAILLEGPEGTLLVDAGPDIYRQLALLPSIPRITAA